MQDGRTLQKWIPTIAIIFFSESVHSIVLDPVTILTDSSHIWDEQWDGIYSYVDSKSDSFSFCAYARTAGSRVFIIHTFDHIFSRIAMLKPNLVSDECLSGAAPAWSSELPSGSPRGSPRKILRLAPDSASTSFSSSYNGFIWLSDGRGTCRRWLNPLWWVELDCSQSARLKIEKTSQKI